MIDPAAPDFHKTPGSPGRLPYDYVPRTSSLPPVISIVTALPESGEKLQATARTILGQSLSQWEWLIVGDRSSLAPIPAEPRIRVLDVPTKHAVAARNAGARAARAPFTIFLESGDLLEPTALEKMAWFLVSSPEYAFVATQAVVLDDPPRLNSDGFHEPESLLQDQSYRAPPLSVGKHSRPLGTSMSRSTSCKPSGISGCDARRKGSGGQR